MGKRAVVGKWVAGVLAAGVFLGFAVQAVDRNLKRGDIGIFFGAGRAILENQDPYAESCVGCGFVYPPAVAVALVPFAALPPRLAATLWFGLNFASLVLLFATSLYLLERPGSGPAPWLRAKLRAAAAGKLNSVVVATVVITAPVWLENLNFGLLNIHLSAAAVLGIALAVAGKRLLGGAAVGAALAPKVFLAPVLPYLLVKRQYAAVAFALGSAGALFLAPALVLGWGRYAALVDSWYANVIGPAKGLAFVYGGDYNISLLAVIYRYGRALGFGDLDLIYRAPPNLNTVNWALAALFVAPLAFSLRRRGGVASGAGPPDEAVRDGLRLSLFLMAGLLVLPFTWTGYYIAAVFPVMAVVFSLRETPSRTTQVLGSLGAAFFLVAFGVFTSTDLWGTGKAVFYKYGVVTAGGLCLYAAVVVALLSPRRARPTGASRPSNGQSA